jgi:hypothetical protein
MKFRSFVRPLAVVAGLVLVLGLALLGRLTLNTPLYLLERGGQAQPQALQFVPKQSPVVASVLVRPDRLATLWEYLAAPGRRQAVRRDQQRIEQLLLANTGLSYSRDIQPWLGDEVTVALVTPDLDQDPTNGSTPGYLVALACRDSAAAQAALELYWQNRAIAGDAVTFEDFSGNRLIYARPQQRPSVTDGDPLATALVARKLVLAANHPDVLRQALTAAQVGDLNLQSDRRYRTALRQLPQPRVGLLALNRTALSQWLNADEPLALALEQLGSADDQVDWGLTAWQLTRQGLVGHAALTAAQGHRLTPRTATAENWGAIAPYLPESLAVAAVGNDLAALGQALAPWQALVGEGDRAGGLTQLWDSTLGSGATAVLQAGVNSAYGLGLSALGTAADWLLVAPQSPTLSEALDALTALAQGQGLGANALDLRGTPAIAWTRLALPTDRGGLTAQVVAQVAGLKAQVDGYEVLAASPATLDRVLYPEGTVRQPPAWWQSAAVGRTTGVLHLDWPQVQPALATLLPRWRLWEVAAQPLLSHLQQITWVGGDRSDTVQTGQIFVRLSNQ